MKILMKGVLANFMVLAALLQPAISGSDVSINIVPAPQRITFSPSDFTIISSTQICMGNGIGEEFRFAAERLNDEIRELTGFPLAKVREMDESHNKNVIILGRMDSEGSAKEHFRAKGKTLEPQMKSQGYLLDVSEGKIVIGADSPQGILYGCMTLCQLLKEDDKGVKVPGVLIEDWPDLQIRGFVDDIARGQVSTMEDFKKIIRFAARYKMNMYMLYLESDMFRLPNYPQIGKDRGALTKEQISELASYAKQYHIEVVPIVQTLGHCQNVLHRSEFIHLAEFPSAWTFDVSNQGTYDYFKYMLSEVVPSYPGPYFHIGCDETIDLGYGKSKKLVEKRGKAWVYAEHYRRIYDMVKEYGKTVMMWDDIVLRHPETLKMIPKDVIMIDWHYFADLDYPSIKQVADEGYRVIVAPSTRNWHNFFPFFYTGLANIKTLAWRAYQSNVLGVVNTNWGVWGQMNFRELTWYANAYTAECAWSAEKNDIQDFTDRFFLDFFGTDDPALRSIYNSLIDMGPDFYQFFDIPFTSERKINESALVSLTKNQFQVRLALDLISKVSRNVTKNRDHFDYLSFIARSIGWYTKQLHYQALIQKITDKVSDNETEKVKNEAVKMAAEVLEEIKKLKNEYASLWLRTNLCANLHYNLSKYDCLIESWEKKIHQFKEEKYNESLLAPGKWIYHKNAADEKTPVQVSYFRKTFFLKPGIKSAKIQTIADDYIKLFVNGNYIGELVSCWSFSAMVHHQRTRIWDITPFISEGKNVIAIEAHEHHRDAPNRQGPRDCGGFNLYGEIVYSNGNRETLISDQTWLCSDLEETGWRNTNFFDVPWLNVYVDPQPHNKVTYPDFSRNVPSSLWPTDL